MATTSLGQLTAEIQRLNPWWRDPRGGWSAKDPDLRSAAQSGLDYRPGARADLEHGGPAVVQAAARAGCDIRVLLLDPGFPGADDIDLDEGNPTGTLSPRIPG